MMLDMKILGGLMHDGTGAPPVRKDVGIRSDAVAAIEENLASAEARLTIDATGRMVCPGFIDCHSHSDTYLLIEPSAPSKLHQGVTTEVVGNCGASAAPRFGHYRMPSDWADKGYPAPWSTLAEYRRLLEAAQPAPNVVLLVGHSTLRAGVVGYENRPATEDELREMCRWLERSLDEGGRGFSSGLIYAPGMFAPRDELVRLGKVVARVDGLYATHMRSESRDLLAAIDEALEIGRACAIRVEVSHLKTSGRENWGLADEAIERMRRARREGLRAGADRYPYTAASTDLDVIFPAWALAGGHEAVLARLKSPSVRSRLRQELLDRRSPEYWATVRIGSTRHPDNTRFRGVLLPEAASVLGLEPVDAVLRFAETDELRTSAFFHGMSEENMRRILDEPYVTIGSDASLRSLTGPLSLDYPHPRAYGTFPRFLRMALDGETVPLPEAIAKMTSRAADHFGLSGRGRLAVGTKADIVVFDPETVRDKATYAAPHQLAHGIETVIVNGVLTLSGGRLTGDRGGAVL